MNHQILVIRHAIAERTDKFALTGGSDEDRPLTEKGARRMQRASFGLLHLVPDMVALYSSPYLRCRETAKIVSDIFGGLPISELPLLMPGAEPDAVMGWLAEHAPSRSVAAVVGHEPDMGLLVAAMLAGTDHSFAPFKKGGACLVEFAGEIHRGHGRLVWYMPPVILRRLGMGA